MIPSAGRMGRLAAFLVEQFLAAACLAQLAEDVLPAQLAEDVLPVQLAEVVLPAVREGFRESCCLCPKHPQDE